MGADVSVMSQAALPKQVAVLGLGYVGLPLAQALCSQLPTLGFDVNAKRVKELQLGLDSNETEPAAPHQTQLRCTSDPAQLANADFFIVAVPTQIDRAKRPDFTYLPSACDLVGKALAGRSRTPGEKAPIVVFESTVYPGCTEEICVPALHWASKLEPGVDFKVGYSPGRINPGDKQHVLATVVKVVSGQDGETLDRVA